MTGDLAGGRTRALATLRKLAFVTQALGVLEGCIRIKVKLQSQRPKYMVA